MRRTSLLGRTPQQALDELRRREPLGLTELRRVTNLLGEHGNELTALALAASQMRGSDLVHLAIEDRARATAFAWCAWRAPEFAASLRVFADVVERTGSDLRTAIHQRPDVAAVQRDALNYLRPPGPDDALVSASQHERNDHAR